MTDSNSAPTVAEFYGPVVSAFPEDIQHLAVELFEGDYSTKSELTEAVDAAAAARVEQEGDT